MHERRNLAARYFKELYDNLDEQNQAVIDSLVEIHHIADKVKEKDDQRRS